jgi:hypothetical protein
MWVSRIYIYIKNIGNNKSSPKPKILLSNYILDSEQSEEYIDFTMSFFFLTDVLTLFKFFF